MTDVFVYLVDLPPGIHEMTAPCIDGYTVYLNSADGAEVREKSYLHALEHIRNGDFEKSDVQAIERRTHGNEKDCNLYEGINGQTSAGGRLDPGSA